MATFPLYNQKGEKLGTVEQPSIFAVPANADLIHRYYIWVRTMLRQSIAHTKTRGEISGGGRKPWKQKGTGRARTGSTRNPIWRHGGIVFGPRNERTFATRMPRAMRRKALLGALTIRANEKAVVVLDSLAFDKPSTKAFSTMLDAVKITPKQKVLVLHPKHEAAQFATSKNLPSVTAVSVNRLNIVDILNHDTILIDKDGLAALEQNFAGKA